MRMANFKSSKKYPAWFKGIFFLLGMVLLYIILFYGQFILMPLALSALLAMLLDPLCKVFERIKIGRIGAIMVSMFIVFLVLAGIISLLSIQLINFTGQLPEAS